MFVSGEGNAFFSFFLAFLHFFGNFLLPTSLQTLLYFGTDCMSGAGPVCQAASVCRDDFQPGVT